MQDIIPSPSYHFASADAQGSFLGDRSGSVNNLLLDQRALCALHSARIAYALTEPFFLTSAKENSTSRELHHAISLPPPALEDGFEYYPTTKHDASRYGDMDCPHRLFHNWR
jgi:hypothetical protein